MTPSPSHLQIQTKTCQQYSPFFFLLDFVDLNKYFVFRLCTWGSVFSRGFSNPYRALPLPHSRPQSSFPLRVTDDRDGLGQSSQSLWSREYKRGLKRMRRHCVFMGVSRPIIFRGEPLVNKVKGNLHSYNKLTLKYWKQYRVQRQTK